MASDLLQIDQLVLFCAYTRSTTGPSMLAIHETTAALCPPLQVLMKKAQSMR